MSKRLAQKETEALRAALKERDALTPEETALAVGRLAPHIGRAALRLKETRAEKRSLRLQAWGLGGCSATFAGLAWLAWQYREFLLETPGRWGWFAGFFSVALLVTVCLPVVLRKEGEMHDA
jgi:hypothetical protein